MDVSQTEVGQVRTKAALAVRTGSVLSDDEGRALTVVREYFDYKDSSGLNGHRIIPWRELVDQDGHCDHDPLAVRPDNFGLRSAVLR